MYVHPLSIHPEHIVEQARKKRWTPRRLAICFTDLPLHIAQALLENCADIENTGEIKYRYE
jgi:hypothetical protein